MTQVIAIAFVRSAWVCDTQSALSSLPEGWMPSRLAARSPPGVSPSPLSTYRDSRRRAYWNLLAKRCLVAD